MKTKKQVITDNKEFKNLINAVISRIGSDSISDVINHGADSGFSGFIYYVDTVKFYRAYKKDILKLAEDMADQLGEDMLNMIQSFNCLSYGQYPNRKPNYTQTEIAQALFSGRGESVDQILNAMSWFALEEVCRMFED